MIHSRFSRYILISSFFLTTSFLECPKTPDSLPRAVVETVQGLVDCSGVPKPRRMASDLLKLQASTSEDDVESDEELVAGEDDGATGGSLWVDTSKLVEPRRPHLDSDSTVASGWSAPQSTEASGRSSMRGSADEAEDGKMTEDLGVAVDRASSETLSKLQDEAREEGRPVAGIVDCSVTDAPLLSMPSARLAARHCDRDGVGERDAVAVTDSDEALGSGGAGSATGKRRTTATGIEPWYAKFVGHSVVDPVRAGETKGEEICLELAGDPEALFKCICVCDRKCGTHFYFDRRCRDEACLEDPDCLKIAKFWRTIQRIIIASFDDPLNIGASHGERRFRVIAAKGDAGRLRKFIKHCEDRLFECSNPCFGATNRANLLYWAGCKMKFAACAFEAKQIMNQVLSKGEGIFDGTLDAYRVMASDVRDTEVQLKRYALETFASIDPKVLRAYVAIVPDLLAYCDRAIALYEGDSKRRSIAMLHYWNGVRARLEEMEKLASE